MAKKAVPKDEEKTHVGKKAVKKLTRGVVRRAAQRRSR
jgi:hypothetical protein